MVAESSICPDLTKRIVFIQTDKKRVLEIHDRSANFLERIEGSKLHGAFYTDAVFGGSSCSSDGKLFVYTASVTETDGNGGADPGNMMILVRNKPGIYLLLIVVNAIMC